MSEQFIYRWREGVRKSEDFWNSCPTCGSLDTHIIRESHPSSGYENTRRCEMCRYEWDTKVYDNDWLDEQCADYDHDGEDSAEAEAAAEEYHVWHNDAYQQDHPEQYPEIFALDDEDDADPILEAELADIERRYKAGLLNGEHADLQTRRAYEDAAERAREDD